MATSDTLEKIQNSIDTIPVYVSMNPVSYAANLARYLESPDVKSSSNIVELIKSIIDAIITTEGLIIDPHKYVEIAAKIIQEHKTAVSNIVKQFGNSMESFENTEEYAKIKTDIRDIINKSAFSTIQNSLEDKTSITVFNEFMTKTVTNIVTKILADAKMYSSEMLKAFKLHVYGKTGKQTETKTPETDSPLQSFTEELIDSNADAETTKEYAQLATITSSTSTEFTKAAEQIQTQFLTYGAIHMQSTLLVSARMLAEKMSTMMNSLSNILNPEKFSVFIKTLVNAGPNIKKQFESVYKSLMHERLRTGENDGQVSFEDVIETMKSNNDMINKMLNSQNIGSEMGKMTKLNKSLHAAMKSKSYKSFRKQTKNIIGSNEKAAVIYGTIKTAMFAGKILATAAFLAMKVLNTAMGVIWSGIKKLYNTGMAAITSITGFFLVKPVAKMMESSSGVFILGALIGMYKILANSMFATGTKLREELDKHINKMKKYVDERWNDVKDNFETRIKEKLKIPDNVEVTPNSILDAILAIVEKNAAELESRRMGLSTIEKFKLNIYKATSITLRTIRFIVTHALKIINFYKNLLQAITQKINSFFSEHFAKTKAEMEKTPSYGKFEVDGVIYEREYTVNDYIFDFKNGLFNDLWTGIGDWFARSWLKPVYDTIANILETVFNILKDDNIMKILSFVVNLVREYFAILRRNPSLSFLRGYSPFLGMIGIGAYAAFNVTRNMMDSTGFSVAERYKKFYDLNSEAEDTSNNKYKSLDEMLVHLDDIAKKSDAPEGINKFITSITDEIADSDSMTNYLDDVIDLLNMQKDGGKFAATSATKEFFQKIADTLEVKVLHSNIFTIKDGNLLKEISTVINFFKNDAWTGARSNNWRQPIPKELLLQWLEKLKQVNAIRSHYLTRTLMEMNNAAFDFSKFSSYNGINAPEMFSFNDPGVSLSNIGQIFADYEKQLESLKPDDTGHLDISRVTLPKLDAVQDMPSMMQPLSGEPLNIQNQAVSLPASDNQLEMPATMAQSPVVAVVLPAGQNVNADQALAELTNGIGALTPGGTDITLTLRTAGAANLAQLQQMDKKAGELKEKTRVYVPVDSILSEYAVP